MRPTASDVARVAGVSPSQVSNFFNHPDRVSTDTERRIRGAVSSLGYVRSASARALRSGSNRIIGLTLLDAWSPYSALLAQVIENEVESHDYTLHFTNSHRDPSKELRHLEFFESWMADGVIVAPQQPLGDRLLRLRERGVRPVLLDPPRLHDVPPGVACARVDHRLGGELAAAHLVERGASTFAFVGDPRRVGHVGDRYEGFEHGLDAAGVQAPPFVATVDSMNVGSGTLAAERLVALNTLPDAIFAANDEVALGLILALMAHGIQAPRDVLVMGYDDLPVASQVAVPLTTVRQPVAELGAHAALLALGLDTPGSEGGAHRLLRPELVRRASA